MTTRTPDFTRSADNSVLVTRWDGLAGSDDGEPIRVAEWGDRSVQFFGTFDGATVVWEGSNDGTNYRTLNDPFGNSMSYTSAALAAPMEVTVFARPRVSGGGGSTDLTCAVLCRRPVQVPRAVTNGQQLSL